MFGKMMTNAPMIWGNEKRKFCRTFFFCQFGKPTWDMFVITQMFLAFVFNKNKNVKKI